MKAIFLRKKERSATWPPSFEVTMFAMLNFFYKEDLQSLTLKALNPKAFCSVIAYSTAPTAVTAWLYEYDCTPLLFQVAISSMV